MHHIFLAPHPTCHRVIIANFCHKCAFDFTCHTFCGSHNLLKARANYITNQTGPRFQKKNQTFSHHSTTIAGRLHTPTGWARPHPARAWMDTSKHSYGKQRWQCGGERKSQAKHTRQTKTTDMDYETKNNTHMWESTQNISQAQYLGSSDGKLLEAFFY